MPAVAMVPTVASTMVVVLGPDEGCVEAIVMAGGVASVGTKRRICSYMASQVCV